MVVVSTVVDQPSFSAASNQIARGITKRMWQ